MSDVDETPAARLTDDNAYFGRPLPRRVRTERETPGRYLAAQTGGLAYMVRLRRIEDETQRLVAQLAEAWVALADEINGDAAAFARAWRATVASWRFDVVNDLIARHNQWYPIESRLPMDVRTGDYVLVNGRPYTREPLGPEWALERFPPVLRRVEAA